MRIYQKSPPVQEKEIMAIMPNSVTQAVRSKYASVARSGLSTNHPGVQAVAEAFGYTPEQLASIPAEANLATT